MFARVYKLLLVTVLVTMSLLPVSGQQRQFQNKSPKPMSFESALPGLSSFSFEGDDEEVDFIEAYFIEEIKKWMNSVRPGIKFGIDYSRPSPEHVIISYEFTSRTQLANNGVWWWNVSNAKVIFEIGGLGYEFEYSIPNFSVQGNNFGNHVLYNNLLKCVAGHSYSYNKSYSLHLASFPSNYNEVSLKNSWRNEGCKLFEGIYENVASDNDGESYKYKLAMKYVNDKPCLIYLDGTNLFDDWKEGEYKAWLEPTATSNVFKAQWLMANKSTSTAYVAFQNGAMKVSISDSNENDTYIKLFPSTTDNVTIEGVEQNEWTGTGFALKNNYIVTNYHVVDGAKSISIQGVNGSFTHKYNAEVIATDKQNDLAILKVNGITIQSANIPYSIKTATAEVGEEVFVLGYPLTSTMGDEIKLTTGVVSSRSGFQGDVSLYQISAPIQPGNSGGPLFDSKGNVIGIVSAKHRGAENVNYAIKASYLRNLMESALPSNILPQSNKIAGQNLSGKVKSAKNYVYYIICSSKEIKMNSINTSSANISGGSNSLSNTSDAEEYYKTARQYTNANKYKESYEWYVKAANLGHSGAQYMLGYMYSNGEGVKQDYIKAIEWYKKAANQGNKYAQFNLGKIYEEGSGVNLNYIEASKWYSKGVEQGEDHAQNSLGNFYRDGLGVKTDKKKAASLYQKSAEQGNEYAQKNLGEMYLFGEGVTKDYNKALDLFLKSANQGNGDAQYYLGQMYEKALGVEKNYKKAAEWYKKSADQGVEEAKEALKRIEK